MELAKLIFSLLLFLAVWLIFLLCPVCWLGFSPCRRAAWWTPSDKIQAHITISSPRLAKLLIPHYLGFGRHIRTNIPLLYGQYYVNGHPSQLSLLGLADYCVTTALSVWYGVYITAYFFFGRFDEPMLPVTFVLLMVHSLVSSILAHWNGSGRTPPTSITREERNRRDTSGTSA